MVGVPRSKGCSLCVKRRVKCDQTRPGAYISLEISVSPCCAAVPSADHCCRSMWELQQVRRRVSRVRQESEVHHRQARCSAAKRSRQPGRWVWVWIWGRLGTSYMYNSCFHNAGLEHMHIRHSPQQSRPPLAKSSIAAAGHSHISP